MAAIVVFAGIEALFLNTPVAETLYDFVSQGGGMTWLLILGLFMVGQWIAANAAADLLNPQKQYAGLFGSALVYAVLFAPMLHYVFRAEGGGTTVAAAALITGVAFAGLTVVGFVTRKDLSFLRPMVMYGFVVAGVLILGAILFGFNLGVWFSVAMIALSGVSILYQTQTIIRKYPSQAHVAAALGLFASVMTMFWYVLRLLSRR